MLIRSLGIAIIIATLSWPSIGLGLGLGEIIVESTLASPLKASIPLNGMERIDLDPDQFFIRLDGTSKPKIRYRLERTGTETASIILYTTKAVTEPLFQFRIEVEWDEGIVARRYDVLIDPPSYQLNPPAGGIPTRVPVEIPASVSEPVAIDHLTDSSVVETTVTEPGSSIDESRQKYGPVIDGNSIWRVARKVATGSSELSIYQWMYGIWKANPQAFTRSNMHRLKIHEFINVPFEWEIAEIPRTEAYQTYVRHLAMMESATGSREIVVDEEPGPGAVVEPAREVVTEKLVFDELAVATVEEPSVTTAVISNETASTSEVAKPSLIPAVEEPNKGEEVLDSLEVLNIWDQSGITGVGAGTASEVLDVRRSTHAESQSEWSSPLESRSKFIAELPVIGTGAPLAFLGRALQHADQFISSKPGWWVMVFGIWVTLVLVMLVHEFRSRPGPVRYLKQKIGDLLPGVATARESAQASASVDDSMDKQARESESDDPVEIGKGNSYVDEILAKAEVFVANGNADQAVELIEATMDIQPDQGLTMHLLEAYHKDGDAKAFETLIEHFKSVIAEMDSSEQIYLQAMYTDLCPDSTLLLDEGYLTDPNVVVPAISPESEPAVENASPGIGDNEDIEGPADSGPGFVIKHDEPDEDDDYLVTQVVIRNNEADNPTPRARTGHQDDTLNEADIYLAYGLYDNAEDLLVQSMEARPGRADYTAKLLDIYFATRNAAEFAKQAEILKQMGDAANRYWDRVQVMGYELAPDNELFSGARNSSLSASDLGIAKPKAADFDLGSEIEDDSQLVETDILLSGDPDDLVDVDVDTQRFVETLNRETGEVENENEAADDLSDLEISFDAEDKESTGAHTGETTNFDLPADLYTGDEETDSEAESLSLEFAGAEEIEFDPLDSSIFDLPDDLDGSDEEISSESEVALMENDETGEFDFGPLDTGVFDLPDDEDDEEINPEPEGVLLETSDDEEVDFEPLDSAISENEDEVDPNSFDGRILYFPESQGDSETSKEFESEVKMTLQSIRDQMQQINERMFSQERNSNNLKKAIGELNELSNFEPSEKKEKSK